MCPPKACGIDEISAFVTDVEVIVFLESIQNRSPEVSLPGNVVAGKNPYLHQAADLSVFSWYIVGSEDPKQSAVGFWKAKGDPCKIISDSSVVGWRTTLGFYEGLSPNAKRTDWMMLEYSTTHMGSDKEKGVSSLCRLFPPDREVENHKIDQHQANDDSGGQNILLHDEHNKSDSALMSKAQHKEMERYQAMPSQGQADYIADGDYLELLDLLDPQSSSSSSENSSCVSFSSDEYFDPDALLQELDHEDVCQAKPKSDELVVSPPAEGSSRNDNNITIGPIKVEGLAPVLAPKIVIHDKDRAPENMKKRPSPVSDDDAGASSSSQKSGAAKGKKVSQVNMLKKLLCFAAC